MFLRNCFQNLKNFDTSQLRISKINPYFHGSIFWVFLYATSEYESSNLWKLKKSWDFGKCFLPGDLQSFSKWSQRYSHQWFHLGVWKKSFIWVRMGIAHLDLLNSNSLSNVGLLFLLTPKYPIDFWNLLIFRWSGSPQI